MFWQLMLFPSVKYPKTFVSNILSLCCSALALTREDGAQLGPAGDAPLGGVLAQRHLQEEDRQAAAEQEDEVRDEKRTWGGGGGRK